MKGYTLIEIVIGITIAFLFAAPWTINAYKFSRCDFEPNYKCEVIHGIGVFVPPSAFITVWFDTED